MDVLDEEIYKCLDQLDTLFIQDLSLVSQWKQEEENEEKKNSVQVLSCVFRLLDTDESLKNNSGLLFVLKCIFQKHKRLLENLNYDQEPFESGDDLPVEAYSLRKYWRQIYPQLRSRILVENLVQNDLSDLAKQFRFSEILEFFLLVERTNFWSFYQQVRKERLITLSSCSSLNKLIDQLVRTIDYEIHLVTNFRYVQNLVVEFSDYILPYSNIVKTASINRFDSTGGQSNGAKVAILLSAISDLNRLDELVKSKSKLWTKLDLPNSVNLKKLQWDYKEHLIKKDYFNFLLNELNKELNAVTSGDAHDSPPVTETRSNSRVLGSFVSIVKVLERYSLIYVKQLKKAFTVIIEVNINQFIQAKFRELLKRAQLKQLYLQLNTLYYVKEHFGNFGIDSNKVNELISDQECEFKAKHLFVLSLNIDHMEYYVCYLTTIKIKLLNSVNFNLFQAQKLYQDLLQEALVQLEEREISSDDIVLLLSNLPDLLMFAYDNEGLFFLVDPSANGAHRSPFQKIVNKFCWNLLFRIGLLNAPIKCLHSELSKIDDNKLVELSDGKQSWLQHFSPTLYANLPYYHALVCNQKSVRHFIFVCRPFVEFRFKFTGDLLKQLVKSESFSKATREYRKNRNRLLKAVFNLATTSSTQLNSLSSTILPLIQGQTLNFDSIQFELLLDDALYRKHATNLNQLDWLFSLVKLVKTLISAQLEIILNSFLYKYTDLIDIIDLDPSIQNLFAKLNLKFLISESYLLDELTESILELVCDSVLLLPNALLYSLETIAKDLKSNDVLIFDSLTAHIILFAVCKQLKSRLKVLLNEDYTVVYSKIVGNLLTWLTFTEDHDLNKHRNKFNDLVLRRMMNLSMNFVQADESKELESLFRQIEINFESYSKDIDLLANFLLANDSYLRAKLNGQEFKSDLNLSHSPSAEEKEIKITEIYRRSKQNSEQSLRLLKASFDYERLLRLIRTKANKPFIRTYLAKRSDFGSTAGPDDQQLVSDLKKTFQIA